MSKLSPVEFIVTCTSMVKTGTTKTNLKKGPDTKDDHVKRVKSYFTKRENKILLAAARQICAPEMLPA